MTSSKGMPSRMQLSLISGAVQSVFPASFWLIVDWSLPNFYSRASCEARPQHYVIILQSQPISCTRRTFLSFFLHHFDEYTEDKLLFKANLPAFFESFHLRLTMFSQYYDSFRIISFFCSNVFYSSLPVIP